MFRTHHLRVLRSSAKVHGASVAAITEAQKVSQQIPRVLPKTPLAPIQGAVGHGVQVPNSPQALDIPSLSAPGFASVVNHPLEVAYLDLCEASGIFRFDHKQMVALQKLARIFDEVVANPETTAIQVQAKQSSNAPKEQPQKAGLFSSLWGRKPAPVKATTCAPSIPKPLAPKGLYIYGDCGCGKTMLLDLFYSSLPADFPVRRIHWHMFARDGLQYMMNSPQDVETFAHVAADIASRCKILLLDEILITNVSEALLVKELFRQLWARGVTVVTTSNYRQEDLYEGGLNRRIFEEFIPELVQQLPLHDMEASVDFRTADAADGDNFFHPIDAVSQSRMDEAFQAMGGQDKGMSLPLPGQRRSIDVPRVSGDGKSARFSFKELCARPLGRAEYAALAESFDTIFLESVPVLTADDGVELMRFVQLMDILYDKKVMLYVQSEVPLESIHALPEGCTVDQEWGWKRCSSMLHEMRSQKYSQLARLMRPHLVQGSACSL